MGCCAARIARQTTSSMRAGQQFRCRECSTHWSYNGSEWRNLTAIFGTTHIAGERN